MPEYVLESMCPVPASRDTATKLSLFLQRRLSLSHLKRFMPSKGGG